ncbi:MAG TPA: type II secretion system protein [Candidatus Saccharimonadales bacterium]|nr:type II secretion system protein [Candidatus Saccharimonadales bacterium]
MKMTAWSAPLGTRPGWRWLHACASEGSFAPSRRAAESGFTLIEIMIVVILIGIMTAMIIPEMKGTFQDALLRSTARKVIEVLNLANSQAVSLNQVHKVIFDSRLHRYSIEQSVHGREEHGGSPQGDLAGGSGEIHTSLSIELQKMEAAATEREDEPDSEKAQDEAATDRRQDAIAFYPDGTADATELLLKDREGYKLVLRINPITARVQVVEQEQERR